MSGGFTLSGVEFQGSVLLYASTALMWKVNSLEDVKPETLAALRLVRPRPELLLLGCGGRAANPPEGVRESLRKQGCVVDAMDTFSAASTFNLLQEEGRRVAAALVAL